MVHVGESSLTYITEVVPAKQSTAQDLDRHAPPLILCVDDDPVCRAVFGSIFTFAGLRTIVCESALVALEIVQRQAVDLAVLDCDMPGVGGIELAKLFRSLFPNIRLVLCSARNALQEMETKLFDAFCSKECCGRELAGIVNDLLQDRAAVAFA